MTDGVRQSHTMLTHARCVNHFNDYVHLCSTELLKVT